MGKLFTISDRATVAELVLLGCTAIITLAVLMPTRAFAENTNSYDFEKGSNSFLSAGDDTALDLSSDLTLETWVKFESVPSTGKQHTFISKNQGSGNQRSYEFLLYQDQLGLSLSEDGIDGTFSNVTWTPSTDTWYHLAATYDQSAGEVKIYVNGSQQGSTQTNAPTSALFDSSSDLYIGSNPQGDAFDGKIDDVRIWNVVRSQSDISTNKSLELTGSESGLVGYWKLHNSLQDETSNDNDLTNDNASVSADVPFTDIAQGGLSALKASNETVSNSTALQNDNHLRVALGTSTTYIIDAVIFASSTSAAPDLKIAFDAPSGTTMALGYTGGPIAGMLTSAGAASDDISLLANTATWVHVAGNVTTSGTAGDLTLKWAQNASDAAGTTALRGSYIRAEAIQAPSS
jgi:Concanavalin A-like lectin/glucanases superfamily